MVRDFETATTMASVNRVTLIGNVGADPEVRQTAGGVSVANFRMATSESWKDGATGERKTATEWHTLSAWGPVADVIARFVKKGSTLYVEGSLHTRKWQDKDGVDRWTTEVKAISVQLLDKRPAEPAQQ